MKHFFHIGVFREGRVVDERFAPEKGAITVGRSADNTIALLGTQLPPQYTLVTFGDRHKPLLHITEGMTGEIALDGKVRKPLDDLRNKGRTETNGWILELPDTARGWVALGDTTFFLQTAPKPLPPPPSTLPRLARGGLFGGLERTFSTVFVVALAIESAAIIVVNNQPDLDPDAPLSGQDLDRFAEIIMPEKQPEKPKEDEDAKKKAEEEARKKAEEEAKKKKKDEDPAAKAAKHADDVKKAVASSKLLQVLGSAGGSGALANVFASGRGFSSEISDALSGEGGVKIANGADGPGHKGASGEGGTVGIGDLSAAAGGGGGGRGLGEKRHVVPQITVDDSDVDIESTSVDKEALNKFIRFRLRAVQSCYEKELKLNPALKGKIVIRFVVTTAGRVGECSVDSDSMHAEPVSSCIVRLIKSWIFPFKPEEDVPVSFPFVFQPGG